ncbi:MAG: exodeoxyribonuclease VII small subunit [Methylotenera sp.]|nr:exodeoxyribonuclease VII small subunit [Methylotenera sp.]
MTLSKAKTTSKLPAESSIKEPKDFEHAFAELESIVAQMESGQMALETSLVAYQRGNTLLQFCQKSLADVEQQVQILNERNQLVQFKSQDE